MASENAERGSNLFFIGYRGTGKTTVAQRLSLALGRPWVDADVEVEFRAGKSIAAIFADQGEPAFRDLESLVLRELAAREKWIVSVGGGGILRAENRASLHNGGRAIWLQASPASILQRMQADPTTAGRRPNLTRAGGLTEIETMLAERTPLYRQCADLIIDTEGKSIEEILAEIIAGLRLGG